MSDQTEILFVEFIVVVFQIADRYQPFAFVFVDLDIQAPFGYTRNDTVVLLSEPFAHVFHLFVFDRCAFGIGGKLLHFRRVLALLFEFFQIDAFAVLEEVFLQQAVYHHIGVTSDRRGEVGIVVECQPVVSYVLGRIYGFRHRAQGDGLDQVLFRFVFYLTQKRVDAFRQFRVLAGRFQFVAEPGDKFRQRVEFVGIGLFVYAVHERFRFPAFYFSDGLGYRAVGEQHELFDQFVRLFRNLEVNTERTAGFVDFEFYLVAVEVDGAAGKPVCTQLLGEVVQFQNLFLVVAFARFYDCLGIFVGIPAVRPDDCAGDTRAENFGFVVHFEDARERQFIFVGAQGADEVTEPFGKHRHYAVY